MDGSLEREGEGSSSKATQPELAESAAETPAMEDAKRYAHSTQTHFLLITHIMIALSTVFDVR